MIRLRLNRSTTLQALFWSSAIAMHAGCDFKINTLLSKASAPQPSEVGFKIPQYPKIALDHNGAAPAFILLGDLKVSRTNVVSNGTSFPSGPVAALLSDIRDRYPTSIIVLTGGFSTYNQETTFQNRLNAVNNLNWIKGSNPMISTQAAWGVDDPSKTAPDEGNARICAALNSLASGPPPVGSPLATFDYTPPGQPEPQAKINCRNAALPLGHHAGVLASNSDYDYASSRPVILDTSNGPTPTWSLSQPSNDPNGAIDATTQLHHVCNQVFQNIFSWIYTIGTSWTESVLQPNGSYLAQARSYTLPPAVGSQRSTPIIMTGNPYSADAMDFDQTVAPLFRNVIGNISTVPVVFVKNRSPSTLAIPYSVSSGGRNLWVVPVRSVNPTDAQPPAYTAVWLSRDSALIKHIAPLTGAVLGSHELALSTPVDFSWKNRAATATLPAIQGSARVCCKLDALMRPAVESSSVFRTATINGLLTSTEGADCGALTIE